MDKPELAKICQAAAMAMAHEKVDDDYPAEL
jgi:hypothetical protein